MKTFKNLLVVLCTIVVCVSAGYFVWSYFRIGDSATIDSFVNTYYRSKDNQSLLSFGSMERISFIQGDYYYYFDSYQYEDSIFSFDYKEKVYRVSVIQSDILYSYDFNTYLYLYEVAQ